MRKSSSAFDDDDDFFGGLLDVAGLLRLGVDLPFFS